MGACYRKQASKPANNKGKSTGLGVWLGQTRSRSGPLKCKAENLILARERGVVVERWDKRKGVALAGWEVG